MQLSCLIITAAALLGMSSQAQAQTPPSWVLDYQTNVSYTQLVNELTAAGKHVPDGAGVVVNHHENNWNHADPNFSNKVMTNQFGQVLTPTDMGHANSTASLLFGSINSMSPAVTDTNSLWLNMYFSNLGWPSSQYATTRVSSASLVWAPSSNPNVNYRTMANIDYEISQGDVTRVVGSYNGANGGTGTHGAAYNGITAGVSNNEHGWNVVTNALGSYTQLRQKPDLVTPMWSTSASTAVLGSAATFLIDHSMDNPNLSNDSYINPNTGMHLNHAETPESIKAALMAGADRFTSNRNYANIHYHFFGDLYKRDNNLDTRFGAGQLNMYNSYYILDGGEYESMENATATNNQGRIGSWGFDYHTDFTESSTATYEFTATGANIKASLVWNLNAYIDENYAYQDEFYDLDLFLYDITDPGNIILHQSSESTTKNTEHILQEPVGTGWFTTTAQPGLTVGNEYRLVVAPKAGQDPFNWDFALAWQIDAQEVSRYTIPEPTSIVLLSIGTITLMRRRSRFKV